MSQLSHLHAPACPPFICRLSAISMRQLARRRPPGCGSAKLLTRCCGCCWMCAVLGSVEQNGCTPVMHAVLSLPLSIISLFVFGDPCMSLESNCTVWWDTCRKTSLLKPGSR